MGVLTFKIAFMIGLVLAFLIRLPHQVENQKNTITLNRKTPLELALMALITVGMIMIPTLYVFTTWLSVADYALPLWANCLGVVTFAFALWLFWRSHHDLGRNWSPTLQVREGHTIINNGVYQKIRHPMYTAVWLWCFAQALLLPNWIAGPAGIISFGIMYLLRIRKEEQMLLEQFGDEYKVYMEQTKRLVPYVF
jgi:protein-S-isoprenylcysteine O-methyltransferase Ste14